MRLGRLAGLALLLVAGAAFADAPRETSPPGPSKPAPSSAASATSVAPPAAAPGPATATDPLRRADQAADDIRLRAAALRAVTRLARTHVKTLKGQERLDAERGLGQLDEQIASLEGSVPAARKAALEGADACFLPFTIDSHGRKMWKEECL